MHAWVPDRLRTASVKRVHAPEPHPAPHEALVAVEAYSVNRGETLLLERPLPGWRPGKDVAGVVLREAADGTGPAPLTRVVGHPPQRGWAEVVAVPTADLAPLPDEISSIDAAALPLAGLTALRLMRHAGPLVGQRLLITGASGGVGHYVVELAAGAGAHVTAISASAERGRRLRELGAAQVLSDVPSTGEPFDVVMESIGGDLMTRALQRLAPAGLLLWFGQAGRAPVSLDFFTFFEGPTQACIKHIDYTRDQRTFGADLATLVDLVVRDRLHPELGLVDSWTRTREAIAALRARQVRGNVVLTISADHPTQQSTRGTVDEQHRSHP